MNPFLWTEAIKDGVVRKKFTQEVALWLKGGTHVALFGPRGTGKTTFLWHLGQELARDHGDDLAKDWEMIVIDLRRALSLPAFSGAIADSLTKHPNRRVQRRARAALSGLEKHFGVNLGVVHGGVRSPQGQLLDDSEVLYRHLVALTKVADRIVIAFDEFQRLASCPGEPLSLIRSALMGINKPGHVSLILTGSLRDRLNLMLHTSTEPIWDQTHDVELPALNTDELIYYIEERFNETDRKIEERAVEHLIDLTESHPKRTQHLAWYTWQRASSDTSITVEDVQAAFEDLLAPTSPYSTDFERLFDTFLTGPDSEVNDARALLMVAASDHIGGEHNARRYGFAGSGATYRALNRLKARGLITKTHQQWRVMDPLLSAWLRRQNPFALQQHNPKDEHTD